MINYLTCSIEPDDALRGFYDGRAGIHMSVLSPSSPTVHLLVYYTLSIMHICVFDLKGKQEEEERKKRRPQKRNLKENRQLPTSLIKTPAPRSEPQKAMPRYTERPTVDRFRGRTSP